MPTLVLIQQVLGLFLAFLVIYAVLADLLDSYLFLKNYLDTNSFRLDGWEVARALSYVGLALIYIVLSIIIGFSAR